MNALKVSTLDLRHKKNGGGSVNILWPNCYFSDICRYTFEKGLLKRPDGRLQCTHSVAMIQFFKLTTRYEWDYTILEYNNSHCIVSLHDLLTGTVNQILSVVQEETHQKT